jgi:hypothetical protein
MRREDAQRAHDKIDEFFTSINEATITTSSLALRMAMLINGGAAIAILTFIGGLVSKDGIEIAKLDKVANSLTWFALGVVSAVAGICFAYLTHYAMAGVASSKTKKWEPPYVEAGPSSVIWRRLNIVFHLLALIAGLASLSLFIMGVFSVRAAILHLSVLVANSI